MRTAYAVIGAHYGDEGKGQVTAWLCRKLKEKYPEAKVLNVLTNGGCQRGHTVHISGDKDFRHVFKHFGSGTPYGAHTHFGPEFILNPMEFVHEAGELSRAGFRPVCSCGWNNRVQLPIDMAVNQYLELVRSRTGSEHGSVGFGINETAMRYEMGFCMPLSDMIVMANSDPYRFTRWVHDQGYRYSRERIELELNSTAFHEFESNYAAVLSGGCCQHYADDFVNMFRTVRRCNDVDVAREHDYFVFENGQGLKIGQQESKNFFHCTPSDTGAFSVLRAMYDMKLIGDRATDSTKVDKLVPVYVTRTYMTRHGKGGIYGTPHDETDAPPFSGDSDATNVPNEFQGSIRYAKLAGSGNFKAMLNDEMKFFLTCEGQCEVRPRIAVTHYGYESQRELDKFPRKPDFVFPTDQPEAMLADGSTDIF